SDHEAAFVDIKIKPHRNPEEIASSETHLAVRRMWLLDQTKEEDWQNYRATLWKLVDSKIPSFLKEPPKLVIK
ncbi:10921_t:CDS:1, partial [Dentiscutata heterogama]